MVWTLEHVSQNSHFYSKRMENGFFMAFSDGISIRFFKNVLVLGYKWKLIQVNDQNNCLTAARQLHPSHVHYVSWQVKTS